MADICHICGHSGSFERPSFVRTSLKAPPPQGRSQILLSLCQDKSGTLRPASPRQKTDSPPLTRTRGFYSRAGDTRTKAWGTPPSPPPHTQHSRVISGCSSQSPGTAAAGTQPAAPASEFGGGFLVISDLWNGVGQPDQEPRSPALL